MKKFFVWVLILFFFKPVYSLHVELGGATVTSKAVYDALIFLSTDDALDDVHNSFLKNYVGLENFSKIDRLRALQGKEVDSFLSLTESDSNVRLVFQKIDASIVADDIRSKLGTLLLTFFKKNIASIGILISQRVIDQCGGWQNIIRDIALVGQLASYSFSYKTDQAEKKTVKISCITQGEEPLQDAIYWGETIGLYTNLARKWGEEPAGFLTPQRWAAQVQNEAVRVGCECTILDEDAIKKLEMGGVLGVAAGADIPPAVIVLEYVPKDPQGTIALVGKGIIFDSGGLQLKGTGAILNMKYDKCGGAAALATCLAAAALKAPVRVVAVVPAVYNKTGGNAMHPRDVLRMMNGKTVEVLNTDAEGRLILADGLHYVEKFYTPDVLIDIATLTGACVVALGHGYSALMSRHERLKADLIKAGENSGDRVWQLPLCKEYAQANHSEIADIANVGKFSYGAGSIIAALFLQEFVTTPCWAHLDIAGTATDSPLTWFASQGTTGAGVRLLVEYITNYRKDTANS